MTEALTGLIVLGQQAWLLGAAVFLRVAAAMAVLPAFGERGVPMRVRLVLALAFTVVIAPLVAGEVAPLVAGGALPLRLFLTETIAGLALGLALRMFVFVLQIAGEMAAQSASLAQIFGGSATVDAQPAFGNLMLFSGLALATLAGLHVKIAAAFVLSYGMFPAGGLPDAAMLGEWGVGRVAAAFALAFVLAAPFVIGSLVYNLALGVINRAMPQLMVAFVGAPAISGGALVLLLLTLPTLLEVWLAAFDGFLADPAQAGP